MKRILSIALLWAGMGAVAQEAVPAVAGTTALTEKDSRPVFDIYGVVAQSLRGGGFGMGIYSPAIGASTLGKGAELRLGGDFYVTGLDHKTIKDVPLLAPQTGGAEVRLSEIMIGFNGVARLSFPWSARVSPYVDGFAGLRALSADISVTANDYQPGYERTSSDNLDNTCSFNFGAAGGLLISLGKNIKLNTAVVFTRSNNPGQIENIRTAGMEGASVAMDKTAINRDIIFYKVGLTFKINPNRESSHCCQCCGSKISSSPRLSSAPSLGGRSSAPSRVSIGGVKR